MREMSVCMYVCVSVCDALVESTFPYLNIVRFFLNLTRALMSSIPSRFFLFIFFKFDIFWFLWDSFFEAEN